MTWTSMLVPSVPARRRDVSLLFHQLPPCPQEAGRLTTCAQVELKLFCYRGSPSPETEVPCRG